jgi:TolB-like protein
MPEKPPGAVQEKPSIAVLPFDDLSPEKDQEYFVLGLSEEILNAIDQIPGLTVKARTSSFSFEDQDKTFQEIAGVLGVDHILQGSVRKADDNLRITARLIKVADVSSRWSETYDRKLKDIFEIQEDIANNVADKLKLTLEAFKLLGGTENVKAYELFLVAIGQNYDDEDNRAVELIDAAIELDPEFAVAWARKGMFHLNLAVSGPVNLSSVELEKGLNSALKAIEIEPKLGKGYLTLGSAHMTRGEFIEAERAYREGMKLTTESFDYFHYGLMWHYTVVGYIEKSFELLRKMPQNDPLNSGIPMGNLFIAVLQGDLERAEEEYERCKEIFGEQRLSEIFMTVARLAAKDNLSVDGIPESLRTDPVWAILVDHIESPKEVLKKLRLLYSNDNDLSSEDFEFLACIAAHQGDPEFALSVIERAINLQATGFNTIWFPVMHGVRQQPRFKEFVREIGLVDYWKEYGWPDLCRPVGDDDFVCD